MKLNDPHLILEMALEPTIFRDPLLEFQILRIPKNKKKIIPICFSEMLEEFNKISPV